MKILRKALYGGAALFIASVPVLADTVAETEPNHPIWKAQRLTAAQAIEVSAVLGSVSPGVTIDDLDFYVVNAKHSDVISVDIDCGYTCGKRSVDTVLAVFGKGPDYKLLRWNDDGGWPVDPGSTHGYDARIDNFKPLADGPVFIGVSNYPRFFSTGGYTTSTTVRNGDYKLVITGVTPEVKVVNIEVKPGATGEWAPINPKSRGKVPVAILSDADFDALKVDRKSLKFGKTGTEESLSRCGKDGEDVNNDCRPDLVCHFSNQAAEFDEYTAEGVLTGSLGDGTAIMGQAPLKVVPKKRNP